MSEFKDKTIIITGASEGIGRALALEFAAQGGNAVLAARNAERLDSLKTECEARGVRALAVPTDVTDPEACRGLVDAAVAAFGNVDVLVCNAGGTMWTRLDEITDLSIFERLMRLNYLGAVYCTFYAVPHLKRSRGRIVGMSSVAGITGVPTRTAYAASKHAMFGFFDSLRIELMDAGVSVTMVAPDYVLSEIHRRALGSDGNPLGTSPMQEDKIMTAEDLARIVLPAVARRDRLVLTSMRGRLGRWLKVLAPSVIDNMAAKAIRERK